MWARQESLQGIWSEWHKKRINARRTAFSVDEFGETDIVKYDLDTAGITGEDNPRTYQFDRPLNEERNGIDIRHFVNR
jgi:hypothetical protein